jgi:hypothetical protein
MGSGWRPIDFSAGQDVWQDPFNPKKNQVLEFSNITLPL